MGAEDENGVTDAPIKETEVPYVEDEERAAVVGGIQGVHDVALGQVRSSTEFSAE